MKKSLIENKKTVIPVIAAGTVLLAAVSYFTVTGSQTTPLVHVPGTKTQGGVSGVEALSDVSSAPDRYEGRDVLLPSNDGRSTLENAHQISRRIINNGFVGDIMKKFPELTNEQLQGLYLEFKENGSGKDKSVSISTGIRYKGSLQQAGEVADFCEILVRKNLSETFPTPVNKKS